MLSSNDEGSFLVFGKRFLAIHVCYIDYLNELFLLYLFCTFPRAQATVQIFPIIVRILGIFGQNSLALGKVQHRHHFGIYDTII